MALEHAILVSLTERAGTGYELARRFDRSIGFFWSASHQQIYRTLKRMAGAGWVDCEVVEQDSRPDKKVYSVSGEGRAELRRWTAEPTDSAHLQRELGAKLRAAAHGDLGALLADLRRLRAERSARLDLYRRIEKRDFPDRDGLSDSRLHQYLVLRGGIRVEEGFLDWCDEIFDALDTGPPTVPVGGAVPTAPVPTAPNPTGPAPSPRARTAKGRTT